MKPGIAIALIVCGTLLVMTPAAYDYMLTINATNVLLSRTDMKMFTGGQPMSEGYRYVCWAFGAVMVSIAVIQSVRMPKETDHPAN